MILENKNEQLLIIQALTTCIARRSQKHNRRKRILKDLEEKKEPGLHQLRRNIYKGIEKIKEFELLREKLINQFNDEN